MREIKFRGKRIDNGEEERDKLLELAIERELTGEIK